MMVIIIGAREKYESIIDYLINKQIPFIVYDAVLDNVNMSNKIRNIQYIGYDNFFKSTYYIKKHRAISHVINFRDQYKWLCLEKELLDYYNCNIFTLSDLNFCSYKSIQDKVCKRLGIPTVPSTGEKIIVKLDSGYSGGTGFFICNNKKASTYTNNKHFFTQKFLDIDCTIAVYIYVDEKKNWYILNYTKDVYTGDFFPEYSVTPCFDFDFTCYVKMLSSHLQFTNRLVFWQFVIDKNYNIYSMDFNCRPVGGFQHGYFDRIISDCDWRKIYLEKITPKSIIYNKKIKLYYKNSDNRNPFNYKTYRFTCNDYYHKLDIPAANVDLPKFTYS